MFDFEKYEKIKKVYKLILVTDLLVVFSAFGFVYSIFSSLNFMLYLICLCLGIIIRYWLKSKITELEK
jgi:hypothetical protein